ncbi:MAG: hypothetical protein ACI4B3_12475 [Prevotella sp.]
MMKRLIIIPMLALIMPLTTMAQDDLYFVPTKANIKKSTEKYGMPKDTYYCGSQRSVDEYNRRLRSKVEPIDADSVGNDVITFDGVVGQYPDSMSINNDEDFKCTRKMSRWDDDYRNAYWDGYTDGRFGRWYGWSTFYDPWYYGYYGWYDPWYYGSWYGWHGYYGGWYGYYSYWYDPWYYGWGGYYPYHPIYVVGGGGHSHNVASSTYRSRGAGHSVMGSLPNGSNRLLSGTGSSRMASRSFSSEISSRDRLVNGSRNSARTTTRVNDWYSRQNANQSTNRNTTQRNVETTRSNSSFNSSSFGGGSRSGSFNGSMGGTRGGGFGGGGARNVRR